MHDPSSDLAEFAAMNDAIGTPFGIIVDQETAEEGSVRLRPRESRSESRLPVGDAVDKVASACRARPK